MIVAVDLGGTRVKAAFADPGGARGLLVAPHGSGRLDGALEVVGRLLDRLEPAPGTAVGMCVPGLVDESGTVVALPGKLAGAVGADLVGWLRDRTGGPAVVVNDAIAYGVGAAGDRPGRTVVMTLGTGVGTAVVEDGRPLGRGAFGGGQLGGQLPLTGDGPRDTSGRAGTIEGWCRAAQLLEQVRAAGAVVAAGVARVAGRALQAVASSLLAASAEREQAQAGRAATDEELGAVRGRSRELATELDRLTDVVHRDEVARAEQRLRIEALETRAVQEYAVPAEQLLAEYGPHVPVPVPDGDPVPYVRPEQERRAAAQDRALALLGRVNPLALEEYAALEERSAFLATQLEDLRATRRDLLTVVSEVDERIHEVFRSAFEDTAREFGHVFATLFPGGEGRLVLTDPDDLLTTGIEVLARPAGKRVSRLSLLSGGERSLTAIAMLVAIFRARPSPFYVLDEVEAALDDRNLGRLLELLEGLRESSQLIVITHQKRTMEIADALYGVTMRGDGVSAVVSQRLREREPA